MAKFSHTVNIMYAITVVEDTEAQTMFINIHC